MKDLLGKSVADKNDRVRVLYSFPHKIGAGRICYTAWQQVNGLAVAGADILLFPGAVSRTVPSGVAVRPTLARGKLRIPYKVLGSIRAFALHDYVVSRRLEKLAGHVDIVHTWSLGAQRTLKTAASLGIPAVLERPNAHTRFAYEVVQKECDRLGVALPASHEHAYNEEVLRIEEEEYRLAYRLLCPSNFTVKTFLDHGFVRDKLARHIYGVDERAYYPDRLAHDSNRAFTALFVGVAAVRKGLHYALEAWLQSPVHRDGKFLIVGDFLPAYAKKLSPMLSDPSVHVLGHRSDVPALMRTSDVMVLPTIEEGFGLVCTEAMASGCVPVVSDACTDICKHMENALVHSVGDLNTLTQHLTLLYQNRSLLERLRTDGLRIVPEITWTAAGRILLDVYRETIDMYSYQRRNAAQSASGSLCIKI
jgi:glycosyltransferase involved in cell wall biosynthesis